MRIDRKPPAQFNDLGLHGFIRCLIVDFIQNIRNPSCQLHTLCFLEPTAGNRRRADTDTTGDKGLARVIWHGVLVYGYVGRTQGRVRSLTGNVLIDQVQQEQMVVGPA